MFRIALSAFLVLSLIHGYDSFSLNPLPEYCQTRIYRATERSGYAKLHLANEKLDSTEDPGAVDIDSLSEEQKKEAVGNLVADDEWQGITMELTELVRVAIIEDMKKNTREFIGKDDYKIGDISKEVDSRVKSEVAKFREKDEYEIGDFVLAMDEMSKSFTEELTGKGNSLLLLLASVGTIV